MSCQGTKRKLAFKSRPFCLISLLLVLEVSGVGKIPCEYWRLELRNRRTRTVVNGANLNGLYDYQSHFYRTFPHELKQRVLGLKLDVKISKLVYKPTHGCC